MDASEFASSLGFSEEGTWSDGKYVISLKDSDDYSRAYTILDTAKDVYLDPKGVALSEHSSIMKYLTRDFDIELDADFDGDSYKVVFSEAKDDE